MSDQNCVHNISLVGLSSLSTLAKELPIPRQNDSEKEDQKPLFDSKTVGHSDAELVGELTAALDNVRTSFSLKPTIHDERNFDAVQNIPLLSKVVQTAPRLLEKRSAFQTPSHHSSAKRARDDKLAKKEKKEKRKKHKSRDEDNERETKEERRARREKRRAEKRARKESDQNPHEPMDETSNSSISSAFSDLKRQRMNAEPMDTSIEKDTIMENLPGDANACTLIFDDRTKAEVSDIKSITLPSGDHVKDFPSLRIGQKVVSIHPTKKTLASCVVGRQLSRSKITSNKECMPFVVSLKKLGDDDIKTVKAKMAKKERAKQREIAEKKEKSRHKDLMRAFHEKVTDEEIHAHTDRFKILVDRALQVYANVNNDVEDDEQEEALLLDENKLKSILKEAAKLKEIDAYGDIKKKRLARMCQLMEVNMRRGCRLALHVVDDAEPKLDGLGREDRLQAINCSLEAGLSVMYVLTAPKVSGSILSDNVIDRVIELCRFQLQNSIYPEFDVVYRQSGYKIKTDKQKRASSKKVTQRSGSIMRLFTRVCDLLALIGEFAGKVKLMDHIVNKIAKMTISPFFVENIQQIQLSAIRCATIIFSKYPQHRQNLVIDILNSLARLPTSKRNLRNYRLSHLMDDEDDEIPCIQMLSALVLQLVQSVAKIPSPIESDHRQTMLQTERQNEDIDELPILSSLELAQQISSMFLTIFLEKISSRKEEIDFRPLFENFIQDLLSTVNKPEWPAAETILSILGRLLVRNFMNKKVEISLRTASLEYLGVVAARLRKDALTSQLDVAEVRPLVDIVDHGVVGIEGEQEKDLLTRQLQTIVIQHLNSGRKIDSAMEFSLNYSIATWVRDIADMKHDEDAESLERIGYRREHVHKLIQSPPTKGLELSYDDICIISRYLSANRSFNQSFDRYLRQILSVLNEQAVQVRTKSLKCLTEIVTVDPGILSQEAIAKSIRSRMEDTATSVREAAIDLIGKFVLTRPEVANHYYKMLTERILDTGVSVRKRVIKILRDLCLEVEDFPYTANACVRMIKRVNDDEEGIKKLVLEVFSKLWFTPVDQDHREFKAKVSAKVTVVIDVVANCPDVEWLQDLLKGLIKGNNADLSRDAIESCRQIADCVSNIVKEESLEEKSRIVACFTTMLLIANVEPTLIVPYVKILHPYLSRKPTTQRDIQILTKTEKILELCLPLMSHPSKDFLSALEMDLMKIIMFSHEVVVEGAIACLGALVNKVSKRYQLVWDIFKRYYSFVKKVVDSDNIEEVMAGSKKCLFLRSIRIIGFLHKTFDFDKKEISAGLDIKIKAETYEKLLSLVTIEMLDLQMAVLSALGMLMVQEPSFMLMDMTKALYDGVLNSENEKLRHVALQNFDSYLKEEDRRITEREQQQLMEKEIKEKERSRNLSSEKDNEQKEEVKEENIKEMEDVRSSQSSAVMQLFLKQIQDAYISTEAIVRKACLSVVIKVQNQGLVAPMGLLPTLIAASADPKVSSLRTSADHVMHEINKRQNVIYVEALRGLKKAFKVARVISFGSLIFDDEEETPIYDDKIPRGYLNLEYGKTASCCHLYTLLKEKKHKRAFITQLLSIFDDHKSPMDLLLYIADNLAYFPHTVIEDVLFIIKHADTKINGAGNDLIHTFEKQLEPVECMETDNPNANDSDSDCDPEDEETVIRVKNRLPGSAEVLHFLRRALSIFMLLWLKIYFKQAFSISDKKIDAYSNDSAAVESKSKPASRKSGPTFEPREVIEYLAGQYRNGESEETQLMAVKMYFKLKKLMYDFDEICDSSDEDSKPKAKASLTSQLEMEAKMQQKSTPKKPKDDLDSDRDTDGEEKQVQILDKARKKIQQKKTKGTKKRRRRRIEDSDSSGSDFNPYG